MGKELLFILRDTLNGNFIKILPTVSTQRKRKGGGRRGSWGWYAFDARVDERDLFLDGERGVLSLFQEFLEPFSTVEGLFCRGIEIGSELRKGRDFTVLSQKEFQ